VRVIDGTGAAPRTDQTVVIVDGRIATIGDANAAKPPANSKVLDLTGRTVIPGLVGMHDHMDYPSPGRSIPLYPEHAASFPRLSRWRRQLHSHHRQRGAYADLELKLAIDKGEMAGPRIHVTGPYLEGPGSFALELCQLKDAEDARRTVEYWIAEGVTSFKAYMHSTPAELAATTKAAHTHGINVTGHLCSIGFREAASLGIDDLEHGLFVDTEFFPSKKPGECPRKYRRRRKIFAGSRLQRRSHTGHDPRSRGPSRRHHLDIAGLRDLRAESRADRRARPGRNVA
jgi:imidazolonepropionase-like amidohydrolase